MKQTGKKHEGHGVFIFAVLALGGIFLLANMGPDLWKHSRTRSWTAVPATILSSELYSHRGEDSLVARYSYEAGGKPHTGTRFELMSNRVEGPAHGRELLHRFQPGKVVMCYVDPSDPASSVLQPSSIGETLFLIAVILVTGLGIVGLVFAARADLRTDKPAIEKTDRISFDLLPVLFIIVGAVILVVVVVIPLVQVVRSNGWREEPCTIIASQVLNHRSSKGGLRHRFDVAYKYTVNGQTHVGTRYDFRGETNDSFASVSSLAEKYPLESKTVCFVNPEDPTDAVLARKAGIGWVVMLPCAFIAMGTLFLLADRPRPEESKKGKPARGRKVKDQAA